MRRFLLSLTLLSLLSAVGCQAPACRDCGRSGLLGHHGGRAANGGDPRAFGYGYPGANGGAGGHNMFPAGGPHWRPPTAPAGGPVPQYAYPYYTLRGPRDFLADNPPSIGPY